ncbi:DUF6381 family protein [Streptomyces sp. NPDC050856]|uniref:DUF6381 family protein n=1 Tax=Streptomyces sp. NPDC050856 TaxID=3154939 RepID=UPI0033F5FE5F
MSVAGEPGARVRQLREKAQELNQAAERCSDPQERQRLRDKARHLQERSEQVGDVGEKHVRPME